MLFQLRRPGYGREALHAPLRRGDQELGEIPADRAAQEARGRLLEGDEQRMGAVAVDVELGHHWKADVEAGQAEGLDLGIAAGLLAAELVAGEAEDDKVLGVLALEVGPELLEALVLRGEAALGGCVDDEDDLALVVGERNLLAAL